MKKYIKPSIEVVQTTLTADFLLGASDNFGKENEQFSKGSSSSWDDEEDDNFE